VATTNGKFSSLWQYLFGNPISAFGVVSAVLLVSLAIAPAKNHFSEWRHYQKQYLHLIQRRGDAVSLHRRFAGGIQQIWLPELDVVDRCTSCHVAQKEASLSDVSLQPFRPHPVIPHKVTQFGCVMCHRGQGAATTVEEAHGSTLAWEQPILPARYTESSCGQCHQNALPGTPMLNAGRNLLARSGCVHCHTVKLPSGGTMVATDAPPSLSHIADKTTREWIYAWLKDPQAYAASATMPNFKLKDEDARDISAFLVANSTPVAGDSVTISAPAKAQDAVAAASLYGESFCASCHAVQNAAGNVVGGNVGPDLTRVGSKVKPGWLQGWLRNERVYDPKTGMPHYRFTDQQILLLSSFLQAKTDSDLLANVHLDPATPDQIAHGKLLVQEFGCASCHEISGIKKPENFAPELTRIGSKPIAQLIFLPGMQHTLPDYIYAKIRQPRAFGSTLKMPQYTFTPRQIDLLTTALLAQNERAQTMPEALKVAAPPSSSYQPAGKAGQLMNDLACFSCHSINGRGGDMAPDLTWEGSAVQRQWLVQFFKNPNTLRPALIRRMPKFNLSDSDINELTDYIMTVYQNPAFDGDAMPLSGYAPAQVEQGRQLFYSKYACQSCHIVDVKNDKGYIGPTLTQVGSRLTAAWIYNWLKNPQSLRPGTVEPNRNMSDEDARALTAFLMTQKRPATPRTKMARLEAKQ
jgi:mono/diheme cytochrome c family protein